MNLKIDTQKLILVSALVLITVLTRFFYIAPNFSPVYAIALFSTAFINDKRVAFLIPVISMLISDYFLGFHNTMVFVYASLAITGFLGLSLKDDKSLLKTGQMSFASAVIFFLVTNFGHWLMTDMYSKDIAGLMTSFEMGLPFFKWTLLSSLLYTYILFLSMDFIEQKLIKAEKI